MKLESQAQILEFNPYAQQTVGPVHNFGESVKIADGRQFRYGKVGGNNANSAAAGAVGTVQVAPAHITNHDASAVNAAVAIGGTTINVTAAGSTAATAGIYDEGYLIVSDGTGAGQTLKIDNQYAFTSGNSYTANIVVFDPLAVALDTSSKVSFVFNRYNAFLLSNHSVVTTQPSGVSLVTASAAGNYMFLQVKGVTNVLMNGTPAIGSKVVVGATTDGSVDIQNSTFSTGLAQWVVGEMIMTGVSTKYNSVFLQID